MGRLPAAEDAARREKALTMKIGGASDLKIAKELGYHDSGSANRAVNSALRNLSANHSAKELRTLILERREQAHQSLADDALNNRDRDAMRLLLSNLDGIAKLAGLNVNEALQAGASAVSAVADLAAASMLQANLIGALHEEGLAVEVIERIIDRLNSRMGGPDPLDLSDEDEVLAGEVVD